MRSFLLCIAATVPLFGDHLGCTITPASGPASGGNTVTVTCENLGTWPYVVVFGRTAAVSTERVDAKTLVAVAPPHLPGAVDIGLFEYDLVLATHLQYTFVGDAPEAFERVLVPIFVPPVRGAFGSEFRTELRLAGTGSTSVPLHGLRANNNIPPLELGARPHGYAPEDLVYEGTPGRFFFVEAEKAEQFTANLRVNDTSRSAENFGTEIPLVRSGDFTGVCTDSIALVGVPSDARFRNTLRIYGFGAEDMSLTVDIDWAGGSTTQSVTLRDGATLFEPNYAELSTLPIGVGPMRVRVRYPVCPSIVFPGRFWAFVSVTNNETQMITTVTPQP